MKHLGSVSQFDLVDACIVGCV